MDIQLLDQVLMTSESITHSWRRPAAIVGLGLLVAGLTMDYFLNPVWFKDIARFI